MTGQHDFRPTETPDVSLCSRCGLVRKWSGAAHPNGVRRKVFLYGRPGGELVKRVRRPGPPSQSFGHVIPFECASPGPDAVRHPAAGTASTEQRALELLGSLVREEPCSFASRLKDGETCRDHMTRMQGVPHPGCTVCEARDFLRGVGREDLLER